MPFQQPTSRVLDSRNDDTAQPLLSHCYYTEFEEGEGRWRRTVLGQLIPTSVSLVAGEPNYVNGVVGV